MYQELSEDNLKEFVEQHPQIMVQYGASWCGNCRIMKPKFKKLAEENTSVEFVYCDAEKFAESRKLAKVDNLPTFAYFSNSVLKNQVQTNQAAQLIQFFNENSDNQATVSAK